MFTVHNHHRIHPSTSRQLEPNRTNSSTSCANPNPKKKPAINEQQPSHAGKNKHKKIPVTASQKSKTFHKRRRQEPPRGVNPKRKQQKPKARQSLRNINIFNSSGKVDEQTPATKQQQIGKWIKKIRAPSPPDGQHSTKESSRQRERESQKKSAAS